MEIKIIDHDKAAFMELLLLADEQENMIHQYLERGVLFALYDGDLKSVCVVTQEDEHVFEIQNLATYEKYQRRGYGTCLVNFVFEHYKDKCETMLVGTGDSPLTIPFYERCGFRFSHKLENYFVEHYENPIMDNGVQLFDKVYLRKDF